MKIVLDLYSKNSCQLVLTEVAMKMVLGMFFEKLLSDSILRSRVDNGAISEA